MKNWDKMYKEHLKILDDQYNLIQTGFKSVENMIVESVECRTYKDGDKIVDINFGGGGCLQLALFGGIVEVCMTTKKENSFNHLQFN